MIQGCLGCAKKTIQYLALLTAVMFLAAPWPPVARAADAPLVSVQPLLSFDSFLPGGTYPLALKLTVARGFHINSTKLPDPNLVPSKLTLASPPGLSISPPKWPRPEPLKVEFMKKALPVYGGSFLVRTNLKVNSGVRPGMHTITGSLSYQGCNNKLCMMPEEIEVVLKVRVGKAGAKTRPLNKEMFGKGE